MILRMQEIHWEFQISALLIQIRLKSKLDLEANAIPSIMWLTMETALLISKSTFQPIIQELRLSVINGYVLA